MKHSQALPSTFRIRRRPAGLCYDGAVNLFEEFQGVVAALEGAGVEYALVGGLAVAVWGAPRATKDMDFLVRAEDLEKAMAAIHACGFTLTALPIEFKDGTTMQRVNKVDAAGDLMTVDFMLVDRNLEKAWTSRSRLAFGTGVVSVISRDALIDMKARAARPQDAMDIQNLREGDR